MEVNKDKRNLVLEGINGSRPVEVAGKPIILKCKWCLGPLTNLTKESCGTCQELLMMIQRRPGATIAILGAHTNVAVAIVDVIERMDILPEGFPEGVYESFDLKDKEASLEVFRQFGKNIRDSITMHVIQKMVEIRIGKVQEEVPGPKIVIGS